MTKPDKRKDKLVAPPDGRDRDRMITASLDADTYRKFHEISVRRGENGSDVIRNLIREEHARSGARSADWAPKVWSEAAIAQANKTDTSPDAIDRLMWDLGADINEAEADPLLSTDLLERAVDMVHSLAVQITALQTRVKIADAARGAQQEDRPQCSTPST